MRINGTYQQIHGVEIPAEIDLLSAEGLIGKNTPETTRPTLTKLGIQGDPGTVIIINGNEAVIGKTGIFELDQVTEITSLIFPNGAESTTLIDYIY